MKKAAIVLTLVMGGTIGAWAAVSLTIAFGAPEVQCADGGANVTVDYTVSSTDAAPSTVVETLRDSSNVVKKTNSYNIVGTNVAGGWTVGGRTKTHDSTFQTIALADGDYTLEVCVIQAGAGGNPDKKVCQSVPVTVHCQEAIVNPCANTAPFGEVTGNTHISATATAQILFSGDFGPSAYVVIKDSDGIEVGHALVNRSGDSCNYHANWKFMTGSGADIYGNHGEGNYNVVVDGNFKHLEFSVILN